MMKTRISVSVLLVSVLTDTRVATSQSICKPTIVSVTQPEVGRKALVLAEYQAWRARMPNTANAHHELRLWCEINGLKAEAVAQLRLQVEAQKKEIRTQRKCLQEWEPRIRKWKSWLDTKGYREAAESALVEVSDPRAVSAIWKIFATGQAADQRRAVQQLGQIQDAAASRGLALLAVSGQSAEVRRTAIETLRRRDPMEYAGVLVGLLRHPVKYEVRPVKGPGLPGSVTVKGPSLNLEHVYAPAPPPNIPIFPDDEVKLDASGLPILLRHTDTVDLPFVWVDLAGFTYPSYAIIPPHVPVAIHLGAMWRENWKSAESAQRQLSSEVAALERLGDFQRAANEQVVQVLNWASGEQLPADLAACYTWWYRKHGRTYTPPSERPRPTVTEYAPLDYMPGEVGGLGFDSVTGYYVRASTFGR